MAINDNSLSLMVRTLITNANLYHYYENTTLLEVDMHFFSTFRKRITFLLVNNTYLVVSRKIFGLVFCNTLLKVSFHFTQHF